MILHTITRWLWFGCWNHRQTIWDHDHLTCLQCGAVLEVLPQAVIRGPAATPEPVRGVPLVKVEIERKRKANVMDFPQSER